MTTKHEPPYTHHNPRPFEGSHPCGCPIHQHIGADHKHAVADAAVPTRDVPEGYTGPTHLIRRDGGLVEVPEEISK